MTQSKNILLQREAVDVAGDFVNVGDITLHKDNKLFPNGAKGYVRSHMREENMAEISAAIFDALSAGKDWPDDMPYPLIVTGKDEEGKVLSLVADGQHRIGAWLVARGKQAGLKNQNLESLYNYFTSDPVPCETYILPDGTNLGGTVTKLACLANTGAAEQLTPKEKRAVAESIYKVNKDFEYIRRLLGVSESSVRHWFSDKIAEARAKRDLQILNSARTGMDVGQIAQVYDMSNQGIKDILAKYEAELKGEKGPSLAAVAKKNKLELRQTAEG